MNSRSIRAGLFAAVGLAAFYAAVVGGTSRSLRHLAAQAASDWPWLAVILAGFALQVALMWELRQRHRMNRATATAAGAGSGALSSALYAAVPLSFGLPAA